jgi:hypothetical protein
MPRRLAGPDADPTDIKKEIVVRELSDFQTL